MSTEIKKNTKDRIFEAAVDLFSAKGYNGTSMRTLAKEVGIKESSLYNHFPGKDSILEAILEYYMEGFKAATAPPGELIALSAKINDPLEFWLLGLDNFLKKSPPLMEKVSRILINEMFLDERCRTFVLNSMFKAQVGFTEMLIQGLQKQGLVKKCDTRIAAQQYVYMIQGLDIENKLLMMEGQRPEEIRQNLIKHITFFVEGIRA